MPPPHPSWRRSRGDAGQASVEFVALLPLLAVLAGLAWQLLLAGHAYWSAEAAARAAARADAVGGDAHAAARARLTPRLARGAAIRRDDDWIVVRVRVPAVVAPLGHVSAAARFGQEGA